MNNQNMSSLYNKLAELVEAGDESVVRSFLVDHIKEFPEEAQKKIAFEFFENALDAHAESSNQTARIQKEGMDSLKDIEKAENTLKDKQKLSSLRSSLGI